MNPLGAPFRTLFLLFTCLIGLGIGVDVTFEGHETSGYFLKPSPSDPRDESQDANRHINSADRFTLLSNTSPGISSTIKAHYGPFSARQTIPSGGLFNFIASESASANSANSSDSDTPTQETPNSERFFYASSDISAHLVVTELRRDNPVLKVLFHTSSAISNGHSGRSQRTDHKFSRDNACVTLLVKLIDTFESLNVTCSPSEISGTCLAEIVVPAIWWPPMDDRKMPKSLKRMAQVEYFVHPKDSVLGNCKKPKILPQTTHLADLPLSTSHGSYEEIRNDDFVSIMVPQTPIYPRSKVYVPVFLQPNPTYPIYVFVIRARVRSGLRILGAQVSQPDKWTINVDLNVKRTIATVTVFVNEATAPVTPVRSDTSHEVFSWLLEVDADARYYDTGMITWNLRYVLDASMAEQYDFDDDNVKLTSRLDIQKDDIQAVLPIAKSSELINTAMLNGRQVSRAMKVFIVSQAGEVSDVTLQSSCRSVDESILKVSSSCTSVYLDGSEIRGSQNASVFVKYGTYTGRTEFIVWMPELPLDIHVTDTKLSQIKNWKVSRDVRRRRERSTNNFKSNSLKNSSDRQILFRREKSKKKHKNLSITNNMSSMRGFDVSTKREDKEKGCRLRYQQTKVEVYAEFLAVDDSSGREAYLISRKTSLKITDLVENFLRVSDSRIASLNGKILQGHQIGRTEVQVLSPITGRVIGAKEVRVGGDRVSVTRLEASVVTGLQLQIRQNPDPTYGYIADTTVSHKLTAKYQEGVLDIRVHFSDGTSTPLKEISDSSYHLSVESLDNSVVAFAPMARLDHPRVIAIGQGKGDLLHVSLELARKCHKRRSQPLASVNTYIDVDFHPNSRNSGDGYQSGDEDVQNDSYYLDIKLKAAKESKGERPVNDYNGVSYVKKIDEPSVQAHQYPDNGNGRRMTPLWIGIYALLGVFGLAIVVFTVSCMVFAVRYRKKNVPVVQAKISSSEMEQLKQQGTDDGESIAHAHDWVWLGRATLERNSVNTGCSQTLVPMADMNGNQPTVDGMSAPVCHRDRRPSCSSSHRVKSGCRNSNSSYSGSDANIRITTNPQSDTPLMAPSPSFSRVPSQKAVNVPSWVAAADMQANRDKRVRIHSNPIQPHQGVALPVPIPPVRRLRNVNGNGMSTFNIHSDEPPPVPPHANIPAPDDKQKDSSIAPKSHSSNNSKAFSEKNKDGAAAAVEGEQPSPCADDMEQDGDWDSVRMGMDYDQLMEYFDNLKESDA